MEQEQKKDSKNLRSSFFTYFIIIFFTLNWEKFLIFFTPHASLNEKYNFFVEHIVVTKNYFFFRMGMAFVYIH